MGMSTVNIGFPITNLGSACIIAVGNNGLADSFSGFLPSVALDDTFRCCVTLAMYILHCLCLHLIRQGAGYSESEVETDAAAIQLETFVADLVLEMGATALELEIDTIALDLETEINVPQGLSKQQRYSADKEWSMLKLLLMGQHQ
jgi:hypothetical protein